MQVGGTIRVPGDKSLSHRALLFAAMARGTSHIGGMLTSLDARSSARVLRQLGAEISPLGEGRLVTVKGRGRLRRPVAVLDCGNSGTTTRLLLGLLAAHPFQATLTGDRSLRRRPMRRVTIPLAADGRPDRGAQRRGTLPLTIRGGRLAALRLRDAGLQRADQGMSAAGRRGRWGAGVGPGASRPLPRPHRAAAALLRLPGRGADRLGRISQPTGRIVPFDMQVPGDPSSAAFPVARQCWRSRVSSGSAACASTRRGSASCGCCGGWGATVEVDGLEIRFDEPVADLVARPAALTATEVLAGRDSRVDRRDSAARGARHPRAGHHHLP